MSEIHRSEGRKTFGEDPAAYDRARPKYPARVFEILVQKCGLKTGAATFEIGPGPGLATRELLKLGASPLVAVEPDARLADFLIGSVGDTYPHFSVQNAAFEDAVLPAQSASPLGPAM